MPAVREQLRPQPQPRRVVTVKRDLSTPENRAFWADVTAAAKLVASWPAWKRGEGRRVFAGLMSRPPETRPT